MPLGSALLVQPQAATAQQGGPPGGAGLVVRTVPVGVGPISSVLGYAGDTLVRRIDFSSVTLSG